jgi:hypothetical protein
MAQSKPERRVTRLSASEYPRGPARIRLPRRIVKGEVIRVQAKVRHPSRTGLRMIDEHRFAPDPDNPAVYIRLLEIFYGEAKVAWYEMSSAISDDPIVTFPLKATSEAPVKGVFTSSEGKTYEASVPVRFTEG